MKLLEECGVFYRNASVLLERPHIFINTVLRVEEVDDGYSFETRPTPSSHNALTFR